MSATPPTLGLFARQLDTAFQVAAQRPLALTLYEVDPLDPRHPDARHFSLMFRGPAQPLLPQATWTLEHAALGPLSIFLAPVGCDDDGVHYQAIFN
jgi:hypothetical protein